MSTAFAKCPHCEATFRGEVWPRTVEENAYLAMHKHVAETHKDVLFMCGRRGEVFQADHQVSKDFWEADGTCSYCGSISPKQFFEAIEAGCELIPTDKNYKAYIKIPNPDAGQLACFASSSSPIEGYFLLTEERAKDIVWQGEGDEAYYVGRYVKLSEHPQFKQEKFYFQHLSDEEQQKLIDLVNAKKVTFGYPGRFYVLPFFMRHRPAESPAG